MPKTYREVFELNSFKFLTWLEETFPIVLVDDIRTIEDMESAAKQMINLSRQYAYITEVLARARIYCRGLKRIVDKDAPETKEMYEDMVDKRDAIENRMKAIQQAYSGISRAVTVRMENNNELKMGGNKYVHMT